MGPNVTAILIKRGNLETDIRTGKTPCEHEDGHLQAKERGLEPTLAIP